MAQPAVRRRLSWRSAPVVEVRRETPRASRLVLNPLDWPGHQPGQHIDVRLTAEDGYTAQRSYSIASAPEDQHLELLVETLSDGEVSPYLTDELRAGDTLEIRGPFGGWFVWTSDLPGPLQLIAGGSGVVPFLAMLGHHQATGSTTPVRLLYSSRTLDDVLAQPSLTRTHDNVQVTLALTRETPPGWNGLTGRINRDLLQQCVLPPDATPRIFVCGPTRFVEAIAEALVDLGHPPEQIKTERFGASGGTS